MRHQNINQFNRVTLLWMLVFLLPLNVVAQSQNIRFDHFSVDQGLSQSSGTALLQDRDGFIWIGTQDGLNKFDGVSFKVYSHDPEDSTSISKNNIGQLFQDADGFIWITSEGGILDRFNPRTEVAVSFTEKLLNSRPSANTFICAIQNSADGKTWFATKSGLARYNSFENNFSFVQVDTLDAAGNIFTNFLIARNGIFWLSNSRGDFLKFDPTSSEFSKFEIPVSQSSSWKGENISSLFEDSSGMFWIGTYGSGLLRFDPTRNQFRQFTHRKKDDQSIASNTVMSITEDANKNLWLGLNQGLSCFIKSEKRFVNYKHDPYEPGSLIANEIKTLMMDNSGTLWIGTNGGGINKYDPQKQKFAHLRNNLKHPEAMKGNFVWAIFEDLEGLLWIGTEKGGLTVYNRKTHGFEIYRSNADPQTLGSVKVFDLCEDDRGNIWMATAGGGLTKFDKATGELKSYIGNRRNPAGLMSNFLRDLTFDEDGFIWLATSGAGLGKFDPVKEEFTHFLHQPENELSVSSNHITSIYDDGEGSLWLGTFSGGLEHFDKKSEVFTHYIHDAKNVETLSNNYVMSICRDLTGNVWVGTNYGLNRLNLNENKFKRYTTKNGLANNVIYGLEIDSNNNIWMSTNKGLSRLDTKTDWFKNFDVADGLQSNEFNSGAFFKNKTGEMFFGGINGLNIFQPDSINVNPSIPPVVITGVKKFDQNLVLPLEVDTPLDLSYKDNFLTFEFAALNYTNPLKNQYAYMLEGFNADWVYCGNQRYATYTNLSPGDYTFRVKGSNNDGVWNETGAVIKIAVSPPFWKTGVFRFFCVLSFVACFVLYIRHLKDREKKKTALNKKFTELKLQALRAQMNPHFIFNTLNSIQYFISNKDQKSAFQYLSKFSKLMRMVLDNSDKGKVTIAEELEALKLYLQLEALRFEGKFDYHLEVDSAIDIYNREIPTLLIQPFVENAIQHGLKFKRTNGALDIKLEADNGSVVCFIEDNGIGIEKSLESKQNGNGDHKSAGMKVSRERLETLNAVKKNGRGIEVIDLSRSDGNQQGTRVKIIIPTEN